MKLSSFFAAILLSFSAFCFNADATGFGLGTLTDENNCPSDAIGFTEQYSDNDAFALTNAENSILLTFDQGYENGYTAKILDILKEKNVKAIFFLTGDYAKSERALVQRMIDEGHVLGNHGMKHATFSELSDKQMQEEIMSLHDYVLENFDYEMQYFRFPCGDYTEESLCAVQDAGYKSIFWSFAYVDWLTDNQPSNEEAMRKMIDSAHGGAIYLLHSVSETNCFVLGDVIDELRDMGYCV